MRQSRLVAMFALDDIGSGKLPVRAALLSSSGRMSPFRQWHQLFPLIGLGLVPKLFQPGPTRIGFFITA